MDRQQLWAAIHSERLSLAEDLSDLDPAQWETPSLCEGLTVREVLAHITVSGTLNGWQWFAGVVKCRFDFNKQVAMRTAEQMYGSPGETLAAFRRTVNSTTSPPLPQRALLGEVIVHGEDIRQPLGIARDYPLDMLVELARYYAGSDQVVLAKGRIKGLRLEATDCDFHNGDGLVIRGRVLALILAMTGRAVFCDELTGEGVDMLRNRAS